MKFGPKMRDLLRDEPCRSYQSAMLLSFPLAKGVTQVDPCTSSKWVVVPAERKVLVSSNALCTVSLVRKGSNGRSIATCIASTR